MIKYRQQHGVNLGSWFVLERWITPTPFAGAAAPGQSDLDVAKGSDAKARLEQHWSTWITDDDWKWIKDHGYNSVRLPVSRFRSTELYQLYASIQAQLYVSDGH